MQRGRGLRGYPTGHSKCSGLEVRAYWACLRTPEEARGATVVGDGKSTGDRKQLLRFEESPGHCINAARESLRPILTPYPSRATG